MLANKEFFSYAGPKVPLKQHLLDRLTFLAVGIKKYWYICPAEILMMTAIEKSKG